MDQVEIKLGFLANPPIMKISALSGKGVHRLFPILEETIHGYHRRIPTRDVNLAISKAQVAHPAPSGARVLYATQGSIDPPTFTFFVNKKLHRTYTTCGYRDIYLTCPWEYISPYIHPSSK